MEEENGREGEDSSLDGSEDDDAKEAEEEL